MRDSEWIYLVDGTKEHCLAYIAELGGYYTYSHWNIMQGSSISVVEKSRTAGGEVWEI